MIGFMPLRFDALVAASFVFVARINTCNGSAVHIFTKKKVA